MSVISRILFAVVTIAFAMVSSFGAYAQSSNKADDNPLLLIINSYNEDELWGNMMTQPIMLELAHNDSIDYDIVYLNNSVIFDIEDYNRMVDKIFSKFADRHPDYIVMIGNFAITLRDQIKKNWGNIPFFLISRSSGYGPVEDYFAADSVTADVQPLRPLSDLRAQFDFTAIVVPDYVEQTIELMLRLLPNMDQLVFFSDRVFINRLASYDIRNYLSEHKPNVKFKWINASPENADSLRHYVSYRLPRTGLLLSSWVYPIESLRGYPVLTAKDTRLISGSVNPVFTLRAAYMQLGTIGGVFAGDDIVQINVTELLKDMFEGKSMSSIPFIYPQSHIVELDYPALLHYGINPSLAPRGTHYINRPKSYLERYGLITLLVIASIVIILILMVKKNVEQRRKIQILDRHSSFINTMPIPYTKVTVTLNGNNKVCSVSYEDSNEAFHRLLNDNEVDAGTHLLFPATFISEISKQALKGNKSYVFHYHFPRTDTDYDFQASLLSLTIGPDGQGYTYQIDLFARDNTPAMQANRKLRKTAQALDMTISIAHLMPWRMDVPNKRIIISNVTPNIFVGATRNKDNDEISLPYKDFLAYVYPDDVDAVRTIFEGLLVGTSQSFHFEFRILQPDNPQGFEWTENHGAVTEHDEDDHVIEITGSMQIITARKKQEHDMAEALERANESDRLKSAFLANMSHEIRTPLNAIIGFSNLLMRSDDEAERQRFCAVINKNNDLLLNLINDVLDLAKIESNTIDLHDSICDINDFIDSIAKTVSIRVPEGVKLNIVHYGISSILKVDQSRLAQVIINLLTNACKFTARGSITVGYEVREDEYDELQPGYHALAEGDSLIDENLYQDVKGTVYFYVRDTGIGISKEDVARVFDRFVKFNQFVQGTGLGLAICQSIIAKMGGTIGVESVPGRGSKFWFTVPYRPAELEDTDTANNGLQQIVDNVGKVGGADFKLPSQRSVNELDRKADGSKHTLLIAEDNASNYWLIEHMLSPHFNLLHAVNGKVAVEMFRDDNPELIIMDINMPIMDGYEAVNEIRKFSTDVPIIAVTAYAFASDKERILNSGFNAYLSKPINEHDMLTTIYSFISEEEKA